MNKIKNFFKTAFGPRSDDDQFLDVRADMSRVLDVSGVISRVGRNKPSKQDMHLLCQLLQQIHLIDFVWVEALFTPMEEACLYGNPWCVAALICHGADVNGAARNKERLTQRPIHYACRAIDSPGSCDTVRMLVEKGADVNAPNGEGDVPIQLATLTCNVEVVEYLLKMGVDADATGPVSKITPLALTGVVPSQEDFEEHDQEKKTEERETQRSTESPEETSADTRAQAAGGSSLESNDFFPEAKIHKLIRTLLEHGANVNKLVDSKSDCLSLMCVNQHVERALILLAYGADVNNPRSEEYRCIVKRVLQNVGKKAALRERFITVLSLILAAGAKITCETLENSLRPVLDSRTELAPVKETVLRLLEQYAMAPVPLKMLCRRTIRACIPPDIDNNIKLLPLPDIHKAYLRFEDIAPRKTRDAESGGKPSEN